MPSVQIADRDGLDLLALQDHDRRVERSGIERDFDPAVGAHPLADSEPQPARHQLFGRRHAQIVTVVLQPLAHLDDVAMALGRQQAEAGALVFEKGVGRDRRAVDDAVGLVKQRGAVEPEPVRQKPQSVEHAERRVVRGRGHLRQCGNAGRVDRDEIGEGAADIDADAVHAIRSEPLTTRPGEGREPLFSLGAVEGWIAAFAGKPIERRRVWIESHSCTPLLTNPFATSSAVSAGSRWAGSPQPPPPPDSRTSRSPGRITSPTSLVLMARGGWLPEYSI